MAWSNIRGWAIQKPYPTAPQLRLRVDARPLQRANNWSAACHHQRPIFTTVAAAGQRLDRSIVIVQVLNGMSDDSMSIRDALKRIPTRMIRFMLRVASLQRGRYMVYLTVGDGDIEWSVCPVERIER